MEAKDIYKKQQNKDPWQSASSEETGLPIYVESPMLHYISWLENLVKQNAQQQNDKVRAENVIQQLKAEISAITDEIEHGFVGPVMAPELIRNGINRLRKLSAVLANR